MKLILIVLIIALLWLSAATALGEMTEYQKGVANGLKIGFFMGDLHGRAQYAVDAAREFNSNLERFREFLWSSFGDNQTLIEEFNLEPIPIKPTTGGVPAPDSSGRIYGYPADAYYTAVGAGPGGSPQYPGNAMGGI